MLPTLGLSPHRRGGRRVSAQPVGGVGPLLFAVVGSHGAVVEDRVPPFADDLDRALASGATRLLVDLRSATSVSTGGLNALLRARQRLLRRRGAVALVVSPALQRLLEVLNLDRRFLVARDRLTAAQLLGLLRAVRADSSPPTAAAA